MSELEVMTLDELVELCASRRRDVLAGRVTWGPWRYDPADHTLQHAGNGYWLKLADCETSEAVLDWVAQIAGKTWASDEDVGALVRAIDELIPLQQYLCGCGAHGRPGRRIDPLRVLEDPHG